MDDDYGDGNGTNAYVIITGFVLILFSLALQPHWAQASVFSVS
jgi:hypothetical protein